MQQTVRGLARLPYARPGAGCLAPDAGDAAHGWPESADGSGVGGDDGAGRMALVVLGMHRSGTSAMARVLSLLGCALPATLMPAGLGNEKGHWESEAICAFDDALLVSGGSHWADWRPVVPDAGLMARGRAVLRGEFGGAGLFVMKDPRQCRLMPFWRDVLAQEGVGARVVLALRHPWEVGQSLARRDGLGAARTRLLWLGHMLAAEAGSRGMVRAVWTYDALMAARGEQALEALARDLGGRLGVCWPGLAPEMRADRLDEMAGFLDPAARHHAVDGMVVDAGGPDAGVADWGMRVHAILSRWAREGEQPGDHVELDAIAQAFAQAGPDLLRMVEESEALAGDGARARSELEEARGALAGALEWLADERIEMGRVQADALAAREEREEARAALEAERRVSGEASARLAELEGLLAQSEAAVALRGDALARREADVQELAGLRDGLVAERVALFGRIERLEQALGEEQGWVLRLAGERHGLEREVARAARQMAAMERALEQGAARERALGEAAVRARELGERQLALARHEGSVALEAAVACARQAAERDHGEREARRHAQAEAEMAQIRAEMAALREARLCVSEGDGRALAEDNLAERYGEIAALTLMLREQVEAARRCEGEAAWIRDLWVALERAPRWWNWGPGGLRRRLRERWLARRGLFDARAYRAQHRDVAAAGMDALNHFILHGMDEGRLSVGAPMLVEG